MDSFGNQEATGRIVTNKKQGSNCAEEYNS